MLLIYARNSPKITKLWRNETALPYTEPTWQYQILDGQNGKSGYDGVHVGDLDDCSNLCESTPTLTLAPVILQAGQKYQIKIKGTHFSNISAFQLGLFVDYDKLEVQSVSTGALSDFIQADNVGLDHLVDNKLKFLWFKNNAQPQTTINGSDLFTVQVLAKQNIADLSSVFHLDDAVLQNALYKTTDCTETILLQGSTSLFTGRPDDRSFSPNTEETREEYADTPLLCYPNPFSDQLNIAFESPENEVGQLTFTNVNGKVVYRTSIDIKQGVNALTVDSDKFNQAENGPLVVSLRSNTIWKSTRILKF